MTSRQMTAVPVSGSLFSGYRGLDMAVEAIFGSRTAWVSEIDPGACKILAHHHPNTPNLGDITRIDWSTVEPVDILTGGFPCQDVSHAGKQAGLMHGTRSGLWHEFVRAIADLRPSVVVIENVRGLLSARGDTSAEYERADTHVTLTRHLYEWTDQRRERAINEGRTADARTLTTRTHRLMAIRRRAVADRKRAERRIVRAIGTVLGTLADLGYDARWHGLRAADVGAPHGRFRVFILATDSRGEHSLERWVAAAREAEGGRPFGELAGRGGASPDILLGTPRAAAGMRSPMRDPVVIDGQPKGRLEDQIALLGTPTARDGKGAGPDEERWERGADKRHLEEQLLMLPTPRAGDGEKGGPNQAGSSGDLMLPSAVVQLFPSPSAADGNGGGRYNSTGHQSTLPGAARLLPTPTAKDSAASGGSTAADVTLTDAVVRTDMGTRDNPRLLPTSRATRGGSGTETMYAAGGERTDVERPQGTLTLRGDPMWGKYAPAIQRWETLTRPAPAPTELSARNTPRLAARFSEWMMGVPDGWITAVPDITRNEALKACGNGVVPQQAAHALRVMLSWPTQPTTRRLPQ